MTCVSLTCTKSREVRAAAREDGGEELLTVVEMEGWERSMLFGETGLPWVLPSPNMPTLDTAMVYPGGCLLEGTNVSEGRGTTRPFELRFRSLLLKDIKSFLRDTTQWSQLLLLLALVVIYLYNFSVLPANFTFADGHVGSLELEDYTSKDPDDIVRWNPWQP